MTHRYARQARGTPGTREVVANADASWALERLASAGEKQHGKREAIVCAFFGGGRESTAPGLWSFMRERGQAVGLSTVRRTLEKLLQHGLAHVRQPGRGDAYFAPAVWHAGHGRIVCTRCRKADFFADEEVEELHHAIAKRLGYSMRGHTLEIFGLCAGCRAENAP